MAEQKNYAKLVGLLIAAGVVASVGAIVASKIMDEWKKD